jgi:hypothetical protein
MSALTAAWQCVQRSVTSSFILFVFFLTPPYPLSLTQHFQEMRRLVRKDRMTNDESAEPARLLSLGLLQQQNDEGNENKETGGLVSSDEEDGFRSCEEESQVQ